MKNTELTQKIKQEIAYPWLTGEANRRFEEAYEALPVRTEEQKRHFGSRIWRTSLVTAAAVFVFLVVLNMAFPAIAESIPGIGEIFKSLNYKYGLGANAPSYDGLIQPVGAKGENSRCEVVVREAYSEGRFVFLSLSLTSQDSEVNSAEFLSPQYLFDEALPGYRQEYTVSVNGKAAQLSKEILFSRGGDENAMLECAAVIKLPFEAKDGEKLSVDLEINALRGLKFGTVRRTDTPPEVEIEETIPLRFEVTADLSRNTAGSVTAEDGDVVFEGYESTPSYFTVTLTAPCIGAGTGLYRQGWFGQVEALLEDGTRLDQGQENTEAGIPEQENRSEEEWEIGEVVTRRVSFSGVPSGTQKVVVRLYNHDMEGMDNYVDNGALGSCVFAEFTVDLTAGNAVPSETYRELGLEKESIKDYAAIIKEGPRYRDHLFVREISLGFSEYFVPEDPSYLATVCTLGLYTDTEEKLPYEVRFYLHGNLYQAIPLECPEEKLEGGDAYRSHTAAEGYSVTAAKPEAWIGYHDSVKWEYSIAVRLQEYEGEKYYDAAFDDMQWLIVNTETGETVYDSNEPLNRYYFIP